MQPGSSLAVCPRGNDTLFHVGQCGYLDRLICLTHNVTFLFIMKRAISDSTGVMNEGPFLLSRPESLILSFIRTAWLVPGSVVLIDLRRQELIGLLESLADEIGRAHV